MQHKQEPLLFSIWRNVSNKSDQHVIYLKQCFLSLNYKKISLSGSFGKILWKLLDIKTVSSNSFFQIWYTYLAVRGFRSEKDMKLAVGFLSRASFAALSAASFPRIPTCPGTDIKITSLWSALILCIFQALVKQIASLKKSWISFLETDRIV